MSAYGKVTPEIVEKLKEIHTSKPKKKLLVKLKLDNYLNFLK